MTIKQGESAILVSVLRDNDGVVISNLDDYRISCIISSLANNEEMYFSTQNTSNDIVQIDVKDNGQMIIIITGNMTRKMLGQYNIECKITHSDTVIISETVKLLDVVASTIGCNSEL